ncbi:MAG: transglycosylase [gamma proteobacterium symbiont of Ctena orbiculata]|nr:MAG: transglycosylase [gamma proteobacterium symbiont of Ctena orbiculata]PVV21850.1 MAG: transglycosylase [gamma proteobacterium symbiont of Ctena orbiculata]
MSALIFLLLGLVAGWLAGLIMEGPSLGLLANLTFGVLGALIGGYLFEFFTIDNSGVIGSLITATAGAILVLAIAGLIDSY